GRVRREGPPEVPEVPEVVQDLRLVCRRAIARDPAARYPDGQALAEALAAWLDGDAQRARARGLTADAVALKPEIDRLRAEAEALGAEGREQSATAPTRGATAPGRALGALEDRAAALGVEAGALDARHADQLQRALAFAPDLPEARDALGAWYRERLVEAE